MAALTGAGSAEIRFFPFKSDRPVSVVLPLAGFGEAIQAAWTELSTQ